MVWVGVDPGLGSTGVAILVDGRLTSWACFKSTAPSLPVLFRVETLALDVTSWIVDNVPANHEVVLVLEHPIFGHNPLGFAKQVRTLHGLEEFLYDNGCIQWPGGTLCEVLPNRPRQALGLSGSAKKQEITDLFLLDYGQEMCNVSKADVSTVADAWAIARCAGERKYWHATIGLDAAEEPQDG